jgi:hypothetical protein
LVQPRDPHLREGTSTLNRRASPTVACWHSGLCGVHRRVPRATPLGITERASLGVGRPRVSLEGAGASADTQIAQSLVRSRECRPTSDNPPWRKFRLCEVALLDHCPRSAHHGSGAWASGCFQTHTSVLVLMHPAVPPRYVPLRPGWHLSLRAMVPPPQARRISGSFIHPSA